MNDTVIPVSNTPIFDQLARERGYDRLVSGEPVGLRPVQVAGMSSGEAIEALQKVRKVGVPAYAVYPQAIPGEPRMAESVHPEDLAAKDITFDEFVKNMGDRFKNKFPNVAVIDVMSKQELNGTTTVVMTESAAFKTVDPVLPTPEATNLLNVFVEGAKQDFEQANPNAVITGITPDVHDDGSVTMKIEAIEKEPFDAEGLDFFKGARAGHHAVSDRKSVEDHVKQLADARADEAFRRNHGIDSSPTISTEDNEDTEHVIVIDHADLEKVRTGEMSTNELRRKYFDMPEAPDHIGEDVADVLYMKTSPWGSDEE